MEVSGIKTDFRFTPGSELIGDGELINFGRLGGKNVSPIIKEAKTGGTEIVPVNPI